MRLLRGLLVALLTVFTAGAAAIPVEAHPSPSVPKYDHVFLVVEENHGAADIVGNPAAPNFNALAREYGYASNYYGITHPSEPNYVALLGGNYFGIQSDDPYYTNLVNQPNLITQLDQAGISWKAYLQGLPHPDYRPICYPANCNGTPDKDPLYASKHDAIQNFIPAQTEQDWNRQVPIEQLSSDLASGSVPAFDYVVPSECQDEHGDPPYCLDSGNPDGGNLSTADPQDQELVAIGDAYLGQLVSEITGAGFWSQGNNAIVITYDEGDDNKGCCDARGTSAGGGQVPTVVVTNHGPRGLNDNTPFNHYSTLQSIQDSFGLGCLQFTCDTSQVKPLSKLLAVTGTAAEAYRPITPPDYVTPSPTPPEPVSYTTATPSAGGWSVDTAPLLGTNDNSLGAISAASPSDVWAVGNFLPDTTTSNQDATLANAMHYDGTRWTSTPVPTTGSNFTTLFGVEATGGRAWSVGVFLNAEFQDRALIESWDGTRWSVDQNPQPGSERDILYGASAISNTDVWAVGEQQSGFAFATLIEHWDGHAWSVIPSPNPGAAGNYLTAVKAVSSNDAWAVGQQNVGPNDDRTLVEHWDGTSWSVVAGPSVPAGSAGLLDAVDVGAGGVWVAGDQESETASVPLVAVLSGGTWKEANLPATGSSYAQLFGLVVAGGQVWAAGTSLDKSSDNNVNVLMEGGASGFQLVAGPDPGVGGSNFLGGITTAGDTIWAAGTYDTGGNRLTLVEHHQLT